MYEGESIAMARKQRSMRANGRRYTMAEKAIAIQIVRAAGGNVTDETVQSIRKILNTSTLDSKTIVSWMKNKASIEYPKMDAWQSSVEVPKVPTEVPTLDYETAAAYDLVERTFRNYAERANDDVAIEKTDGPAAAKVMADMAKLMQLLQGLPTEIVALTSQFVEAAKRRNANPMDIMREAINELDSENVDVERENAV